ncbi:MAG: XRE family transcriptional regulator [Lachnospiraceae bacterium]|nr:XRE family transcriptional regulator [Lachnospiraceae bacterium]
MVVNVQRLKGKIVERETTQECVADAMGMNRTTFYRKMKNGGNGFTVGDIHKMIMYIPLTKDEAVDIFFTD